MAGPPPNPANPNVSSHPSPPSVSSQSSIAFTPSATSVADSSDNEFDPTPVHSPGGPRYDDLPPSYDDARYQAVHDARNGIAPIDPNQIEAHRIALSQGPNDPEIWEYRIRGEQLDPTSEQEQAPDYANHRSDKATSVPVQHVSSTENIPVGRMRSEFNSPQTPVDLASAMLNQALEFTRQQPNTPAQHAPRLSRIIAIPGEGGSVRSAEEHEQFLCAYTQTLHGHAIEPDQFLSFLRGLNVLLRSTNTTATDLLRDPSGLVDQYIRGANEAFFAPRGLRVSFRSEAAILASLPLPTGPGQRDAVADRLLEEPRSAATRAQRLTPWIEPLNTEKLPAPSEHMYRLHEMGERFSRQATSTARANAYDDPPHSIPTMAEEAHYGTGQQPTTQRRGNWSPFGPPGHGPFGAPGNRPFGAPDNGPFGRPGRAPFGAAGFGSFGARGHGNLGAAGPSRQGDYSVGKEWAEVGKEIGKIGEEFGKMMGDLGMQFGQRANRLGMNLERMTSGSSSRQAGAPRSNTYGQAHDDLPPSYEPPSGQESGVIPGDHKIQPDYDSSKMTKEKSKETHVDDDDDDASSLSSDSSDSDSDSDSDDEDYRDAEKECDKRLRSIEEFAAKSAAKGTKTPEEISRERASAVEKVQKDKQKLASKFAMKQSKRAAMREVRKRSRQLKKEHRQRKRELRASSSSSEGKGKGKAKAKKSKEWKEEKKAYKDLKKVLRKDKLAARKEWRDARKEWRETRNDIRRGRGEVMGTKGVQGPDQDELVWLVVENLGP
ncbi:hypothetical protein yc1106_06585 [Curvularia clavata]|uniref:Uncharacterized protein n=1 Tax=Curvularia clavata TaxID=95742 RepID=A0A9Q9DVC9_CURCL|nr:hypothetical protein yc1106_06585 [Curvularia clavata]